MAGSEPLDLRLVPGALAAWTAAALSLGWTPGATIGTALLLWAGCAVALALDRIPSGRRRQSLVAALVVAAGALASAGLRVDAVRAGPLPGLASAHASMRLSGVVTGDPVRKAGTFAPYVVVPLSAREVTARDAATRVRSPILVIGAPGWSRVAVGDHVDGFGHLEPPEGLDLSAVLIASGDPVITAPAGRIERSIARVRSGLTEAGKPLGPSERALLPALVDGDVSAMPEQTTADFKTSGLTHLLAVSGSNLTLVLGFAVFLARWLRIRGYALAFVGVAAVVFFVLLARPQPSVLRAAAMGVVALAGVWGGSRARGVRVLCVAVVVLLLVDPWLARSVGFILSTLASAGILLLAPWWRDLLGRWMPRALAEAVAVPMAAQIVCTPVIAAISGQVSIVAVLANMAVAPAIGPATVASLLAGLSAMVSVHVGHLAGRIAGIPLWWIVQVAEHSARLSGASVRWGAGVAGIAALTAMCVGFVALTPVVLPRRWSCLGISAVLVLAVFHPPWIRGWPPAGWLMVVCDVGQGDGMVLNAGHGVAVVVDTGPDPVAMTHCLDALGIRQVALVVLTHFHADHVGGLPGVLAGRAVDEIETSPYDEPADGFHAVMAEARSAGVRVSVATTGERRRIGRLTWQVLGPPPSTAHGEASYDGGSGPNNASVIMLLRVEGFRVLLAGDAETEEEEAILQAHERLRVDVLKEPHHGSAAQDPAFLAATHAAVSLISVGAGNPYGHPAQQTLTWLAQLGMSIYRTDLDGDIAVVASDGRLAIVTRR